MEAAALAIRIWIKRGARIFTIRLILFFKLLQQIINRLDDRFDAPVITILFLFFLQVYLVQINLIIENLPNEPDCLLSVLRIVVIQGRRAGGRVVIIRMQKHFLRIAVIIEAHLIKSLTIHPTLHPRNVDSARRKVINFALVVVGRRWLFAELERVKVKESDEDLGGALEAGGRIFVAFYGFARAIFDVLVEINVD